MLAAERAVRLQPDVQYGERDARRMQHVSFAISACQVLTCVEQTFPTREVTKRKTSLAYTCTLAHFQMSLLFLFFPRKPCLQTELGSN